MDSPLKILEKDAEWYSLYIKKLRKSYSRGIFFKILKFSLNKKFPGPRLGSLIEDEDIVYFVFSGDIQSTLEGFVKEYIGYVRGKGDYYDEYLKKISSILKNIYLSYTKKRNDTYLLDVAIRKFLIYTCPDEAKVGEIVSKFNSLLSNAKREVKKEGANIEEHISSYIEKGIYFRKPLDSIRIRDFSSRVVPEKQWVVKILNDFSNDIWREPDIAEIRSPRFKKLETAGIETRRLRERLISFASSLKEQLQEDIPPVYLVDRLTRLESAIRVHMGAARGLLHEIESEKVDDDFDEHPNIPRILGFVGIKPDKFIPSFVKEKMVREIERGKYEIPDSMKQKKIFKKAYDYEKIWNEIEEFYISIFEPSIYHKILEEMIELWPVPRIKKTTSDEARWVGVKARTGGVIFLPEGIPEYRKKRVDVELFRLGRVVSVLIYDIRGSTFMGEKLRNAKKEEEIRKKFQDRLIRVALSYGGFPLKDTGDGGIVFFSANSHELYERFQEMRIGKIQNIPIKLFASRMAARQAVLCARDMVKESENFVRENLENYKEWFKSVDGVELQFGGITYEKLPPSFKKIFQIGVGVASGDPGTDLSFNINAFGEPDVTGNIVRYANTYSKQKAEAESIIMVDARTALSFLLSLEKFEEFEKEKNLKGGGYESNIAFLISEMKRWYNGFHGRYVIENNGVGIMKTVERFMGKTNVHEDIRVKDPVFDGFLSPEKAFEDLKSGRVFALYRIIPKGG